MSHSTDYEHLQPDPAEVPVLTPQVLAAALHALILSDDVAVYQGNRNMGSREAAQIIFEAVANQVGIPAAGR